MLKRYAIWLVLLLVGCANPEYNLYLETTAKIEAARDASRSAEAIAKHNADAARYKAMSDIASTGDQTAKVAAVIAMAIGEPKSPSQGYSSSEPKLTPPPTNQALQWASILVPSLTQMVGMNYNYRMAETQSNNARDIAISTNQTYAGLGTNIKDTAALGFTANSNIANSGFTSATTIAGSGFTATSNLGTNFGTNMATIASSGFTALTNSHLASSTGMVDIAKLIQAPAANVTTTVTGDGVVGSGSLTKTTNANPTTTTSTTTTTTSTANPTTTTTTNANPTTTTTTTNANPTTTTTDNHTTNPTVLVDGKVCTVTAAGALTCL